MSEQSESGYQLKFWECQNILTVYCHVRMSAYIVLCYELRMDGMLDVNHHKTNQESHRKQEQKNTCN
ncbi:CLUMA_CG019170, isoform A [Clunio marinus]|uniref:CLUMA_CG019170, isoform A n=1 Tax=Clunio marinus TaxID=568069 RepID=A0A1J1J3D7_9DIPT|nr:CLUMA_CG019170, isoform A [Clunio marinus]